MEAFWVVYPSGGELKVKGPFNDEGSAADWALEQGHEPFEVFFDDISEDEEDAYIGYMHMRLGLGDKSEEEE